MGEGMHREFRCKWMYWVLGGRWDIRRIEDEVSETGSLFDVSQVRNEQE